MDNRKGSEDSRLESFMRNVLASMYFIRPGVIEAFDPETNYAAVAVGIQQKITKGKRVSYATLPLIVNVPLSIPYAHGSGLALTIPVKKGDPCTLLFSDRMLDQFLKEGTYAPPEQAGPNNAKPEPRMHVMTDAICLPGLITQKHIIPRWNTENIELRDIDRKNCISLGKSGIEMTDGEAVVKMSGGRVEIAAPNGLYIDAPNFKMNDKTGAGYVKGVMNANNYKTESGFDANEHRHGGVEPGGGTSGKFV